MNTIPLKAFCIAMILLTHGYCPTVQASTHFEYGNEAIPAASLPTAMAGLLPLINDSQGVFHLETNGQETWYFAGDTSRLNAVLAKIPDACSAIREVHLLAGPGTVGPIVENGRDQAVAFDWRLDYLGGTAASIEARQPSHRLYADGAVLSIYVGRGGIDLDTLQIPAPAICKDVESLKERYAPELSSESPEMRANAMLILTQLDSDSEPTFRALVNLRNDPDPFVRKCALSYITRFPRFREEALTVLRQEQVTADAQLEAYPGARSDLQSHLDKPERTEYDAQEAERVRGVRRHIHEFQVFFNALAGR
ncbi:MAG: hypothetical protein HYV27_10860 [Candidatus Hydrogenedentes bacterium]|nr:hypothetical protein [Candidatus Hydrogenedentota bacterium]